MRFSGGGRVSAAISQDQANPIEPRSVGLHRARKSPACTTERAASCDGCRVRAVSPCASLPDIGATVVPSFRISEQWYPASCDIVEQGEAGHEFCVITDGWAVQYELLEDGRRQILDFLLPGSIAGFRPGDVAWSPHFVQALTDVLACRFATAGCLGAAKSNPALALRLAEIASRSHYRTLRRLTLIGRRTAKERVAGLLFELSRQVQRCSLSPWADELSLPLTQEHIGDALGLTNVHVNRMLRELREEGVLVLKRGLLQILDPARLVEIVGYDDDRFVRHPSSKVSILRTVQREPARRHARGIFDLG